MAVTYSELLAIGLTTRQARILVQLPYRARVSMIRSRSRGRPTLAFDTATVIARLDALGGDALVTMLLALKSKTKQAMEDSNEPSYAA